ncbi:helix-turn-helix transcriptional regulator [Nocardia vulneris]|uniref:helix-turn-helix transcriptional regulator n=1 Tax=Nocardia vulneris TaxID=1141657 RepID=UPI0007A42E30|nr:helix-turn-helix transcriptional regulator [Nocardia vulneris]
MTASIAEQAGARAKELARLRIDLAAGRRLTKADVALAVERAEQSRARAEAARRRAIAAYERAACSHDRAASAHEDALSRGRGNATAHERAVAAHRAAARLDRLAAEAAEKDCPTSRSSADDGAQASTLQRAIDYVHANVDRRITLAELAETTGVSERALQYAFHSHCHTSPLGYLQQVRLDHAHADLRAAAVAGDNPTIAEIAARWGFTHPGRFAASYQKRFGRPPSRTLHG